MRPVYTNVYTRKYSLREHFAMKTEIHFDRMPIDYKQHAVLRSPVHRNYQGVLHFQKYLTPLR